MQSLDFPTSAGRIAQLLEAELVGDPEHKICVLSTLEMAREGHLTYFSDRKYEKHLITAKGATIITRKEFVDASLPVSYVVVENPKLTFSQIAKRFTPRLSGTGVSPLAFVNPDARVGARSVIHPFAYVGPNVEIGEDTEIYPNVVLVANIRIGNRVKILPGTVIGSDGFGYLEVGDAHLEVPQIGHVIIEDDVRIGAKCTVDRATIGETRVGAGTKLDDHVHVGHNSRIGKNCIICGQVALGGSTVLEDNVILAGQVGIGGHCTVGKGARMGAQSGTSSDLKPGETYLLSPAVPIKEALRMLRYLRKLPKLYQRLQPKEES